MSLRLVHGLEQTLSLPLEFRILKTIFGNETISVCLFQLPSSPRGSHAPRNMPKDVIIVTISARILIEFLFQFSLYSVEVVFAFFVKF